MLQIISVCWNILQVPKSYCAVHYCRYFVTPTTPVMFVHALVSCYIDIKHQFGKKIKGAYSRTLLLHGNIKTDIRMTLPILSLNIQILVFNKKLYSQCIIVGILLTSTPHLHNVCQHSCFLSVLISKIDLEKSKRCI